MLKLCPPSTARSVNVVVFFPVQQLSAAEHIPFSRALTDYGDEERVIHRTTLVGEVPV
jgi:hypothetical protein